MSSNRTVIDTFSSVNRETIEQDLRKLGFPNIQEIFQTATFESDSDHRQMVAISMLDPSTNPNEINFRFMAATGMDGQDFRIHQVTATKEFRSHIHSKNSKTIEQAYAIFSGIPTKEQITHEMLLQIRHERNRQNLFENNVLRRQLTKMGFNYNRLVAGAYEISTNAAELKGVTIAHEELPILGNRPHYPKQVTFVLHLRKPARQQHHLESIYTSIYKGRPNDGSSNPQITYNEAQGKFPTKLEMIENLSKLMPRQYASLSNAEQLLHLINDSAEKKTMNIFRRLGR